LDCGGGTTNIPKAYIQNAYGSIVCNNSTPASVHRASAQLIASFFSSYLMNDVVITLDTWKKASTSAQLPWQLFDCQHINDDQQVMP